MGSPLSLAPFRVVNMLPEQTGSVFTAVVRL